MGPSDTTPPWGVETLGPGGTGTTTGGGGGGMFGSTLPAQTSRLFPRPQGRTGRLNLEPLIDTDLEPSPDTNTYPGPEPEPVEPQPVEPEPAHKPQHWAGTSPAREAQPALRLELKNGKKRSQINTTCLPSGCMCTAWFPGFYHTTRTKPTIVCNASPPPNRAVEDWVG